MFPLKKFKSFTRLLCIFEDGHLQNLGKRKNCCKHYLRMASSTSTIAICQMTSTSDKEKNFETCRSLILAAKERKAKMVFLPECFDLVAENKQQAVQMSESLDGPLMKKYSEMAAKESLWLSLGGFHEKDNGEKIHNTHIVINDQGQMVATYRKVHLFDVDIPGRVRIKESDFVLAGKEIVAPITTPIGQVGLGICYDMRFPEFSLALTKAGAQILTYPSAFMQATGMAHWESLLRARAIESECYVVAAAQTGAHNNKRASYGHAMVIDPWGCIIACCSEGSGVAVAEINLDYVKNVREGIPVWKHRRPELYGDITSLKIEEDHWEGTFMFGPYSLQSSELFHKTPHTMAFVNKMPIMPGHVLISPIRCVPRMKDLSSIEVADLFRCVQKVQSIIEKIHNTTSSTIAIQDGPDAGQTVPHVHVHILPRKPGDFKNNDDVYVELQQHDKQEGRKPRSPEDMAEEAKQLRTFLSSN